jgi:pilus assembly protein CpaE
MDTRLPDKDGFQVTEEILAEDPSAQIIFSAIDTDGPSPERVLDCGAVGFVSIPINPDRVIEKVRRAAERGRKLRKGTTPLAPLPRTPQILGKIIAVYGARGGAGCSTIAANLALLLQTEDMPTVLVDAHRQFGDVDALLNTNARYTLDNLVSQAESLDGETIREMLAVHASGLRVLAGPASLEGGEDLTADGFRHVLTLLQAQFAYLVLDFACHLDDVALTALGLADITLVVMAPDIPSIKNTRLFLNELEQLSIPSETVMLVLNQVDRRVGLRGEDVGKAFRIPVSLEIPFEREVAMMAVNKGEPIMATRKTSPLARSFLDLLAQVKERLLARVPAI